MSQRSNIDAAVLLKSFFRHNLRNITIRQTRDDIAAQEAPVDPGAFSFGLAPGLSRIFPDVAAIEVGRTEMTPWSDSAASATGLLSNPVRLVVAKLGGL